MKPSELLEESFSHCRIAMEDNSDAVHAELLKLIGINRPISREGLLDFFGNGLKKVNEISIKEYTDSINAHRNSLEQYKEKVSKFRKKNFILNKYMSLEDEDDNFIFRDFIQVMDVCTPAITGMKWSSDVPITIDLMVKILNTCHLDINFKGMDLFLTTPLEQYNKNINAWVIESWNDDDYERVVNESVGCISIAFDTCYAFVMGSVINNKLLVDKIKPLDLAGRDRYLSVYTDGNDQHTYSKKYLKFILDNNDSYLGSNLDKLYDAFEKHLDNYIKACKTLYTFVTTNTNVLKEKFNIINKAIKEKDKEAYKIAVEDYKHTSRKIDTADHIASIMSGTSENLMNMFDIYKKA